MHQKLTKQSESFSKEQRIADILKTLSKNIAIQSFATQYLNAISLRLLSAHSTDYFKTFIQERFSFFKHNIDKPFAFQIHSVKDDDSTYQNTYFFESTAGDAPYLIVTLEALFLEVGLKMSHKIHPIMGVEFNGKKQVQSFDSPSSEGCLYSFVYVEFYHVDDETQLSDLKPRIQECMSAVQLVKQDQNAMRNRLDLVKNIILNTDEKIDGFTQEWMDLIDWLKNLNFSLFGSAEYQHGNSKKDLKLISKTGLGVLRSSFKKENTTQLFEALDEHTLRMKDSEFPYMFDLMTVPSMVQRFENLMRLSFKLREANGNIKEYIFVGILKRSSTLSKNIETPLIHLKMKFIFESRNMLPGTYNFNEVIKIFTATPKYELFRTPAKELLLLVDEFLSINNPNEVYCFSITRVVTRPIALYIFIPKALFIKENVQKIKNCLKQEHQVETLEVIEIEGEEICRLHVYIPRGKVKKEGEFDYDRCRALEAKLRELIKPWDEQMLDQLVQFMPRGTATELYQKYSKAFPSHYKFRRDPAEAARDLRYLEMMLFSGTHQFNFCPFLFSNSVLAGKASVLYIYSPEKLDLIKVMPIIENLGVYVYDEMTTRIGSTDDIIGYIHALRVVDKDKNKIDESACKEKLLELLRNIFLEDSENDPLNAMVINGNLDCRQINLLQTYRNLYSQIGAPYSKAKINEALILHPECARILVTYFEEKFSLLGPKETVKLRTKKVLPKLRQAFIETLQSVSQVADDTILKRLLNLMENTVRTNYFIRRAEPLTTISIKLDSQNVKQMPSPVPFKEIYVHDTHMEGTHLRFGKVARGGLRWSDRHDDFRTEILGLVKTQQTKNVVIVPVGSKGGFTTKRSFDNREETLNEGQTQYRRFINSLLDVSDNLDKKGKIIPAKDVVAYDDLDPYLVVAADKGTAQFSDLANEISNSHNFWLGDAFASGGSVGYNHKEVGITAKGAWECVKLHFKSMGHDTQTQPFTVAGVGDMSGDVFGNGMLLSKQIKLVAAFNHMHIFIDPDPDPEKSWKERDRLFKLPRSAWTDYKSSLISKGGGIFNRKAKEVALSPQMKKLLNVKENVLTGEQLIRAVLKMQVDLLWFGGIGTYIKSPYQTHLEVGDPNNDSVRVDTDVVNAKVLGEGANLAITQEGRFQYSLAGGRINTDFIDNSAGVNMSDYEVNIKIFLKYLLENKKIKTMTARNNLLERETDDVTELVLENNRAQHQLISTDSIRSVHSPELFIKLIDYLTARKILDPKKETIPDHTVLNQLSAKGKPIPRPVLAVIMAYTKMWLYNKLLPSKLIKDPFFRPLYLNYFPSEIKKKFHGQVDQHHLKPEILATQLTNNIINQTGITFFFEVKHQTKCLAEEIAAAYVFVDHCFSGDKVRQRIQSQSMALEDQFEALIEFEETLKAVTASLLQLKNFKIDFAKIDVYQSMVTAFMHVGCQLKQKATFWSKKGMAPDLACEFTGLKKAGILPHLFTLFGHDKAIPDGVITLIVELNTLFGFDELREKLDLVDPKNRWEAQQQIQLLQDLQKQRGRLLTYLTSRLSNQALKGLTVKKCVQNLSKGRKEQLDQHFSTLTHIQSRVTPNLTQLAVAVNGLGFLYEL